MSDRLAEVQGQNAVGETHRQLQVVLNQEDRQVQIGPQPTKLLAQFRTLLGVHPCGGLVYEKQLRLHGQRPCEFDPLLSSVWQLTHGSFSHPIEIEELQDVLNPLPVFPLVASRLGSAIHHGQSLPHAGRHMLMAPAHQVVDRALVAEQLDVLECPGDTAPRDVVATPPGDPLAFEVYLTRRRPVDPVDAVEGGRLPRAVGPDHREDGRALYLEGDIVERSQPTKTHRESFHREEGHLDLPLVVVCEESGRPEPEHEDDDQKRDSRLELDRDVGAKEVLDHAQQVAAKHGAHRGVQSP